MTLDELFLGGEFDDVAVTLLTVVDKPVDSRFVLIYV